MQSPKKAIVLQIDGLRPSMLGPYGNTWFDTPNFNRLASESILYEQCLSESPDLDLGSKSLLGGTHPITEDDDIQRPLTDSISNHEFDSIYVTDRKDNPLDWGAESFDRILSVWQDAEQESDSGPIESCQLASFFAQSIACMNDNPDSDLFWLDCQGMLGAWDAPYEFRCQLADEEDPEPDRFHEAPSRQFNPISDDPDLLLGYQQAYGGQVILLDHCLGILLDYLDELTTPTLFCLTSPRGYPLGEHGVVGFYRHILNNESIHVPCFVRWPQSKKNGLLRRQDLTSPSMIQSCVSEWLTSSSDERRHSSLHEIESIIPDRTQQAIISTGGYGPNSIKSIQTHAWKYIRGSNKKLFVRPDDIWEFNDVLSRCPDIGKELDRLLDLGIENLQAGNPLLTDALSRELAFGVN